MDALQEQLRHLATQPEFIAQFLHEGAYVFPVEGQPLEEVKLPVVEATESNSANAVPVQPAASAASPQQPQTSTQTPVAPKVEPVTPTTSIPTPASHQAEIVSTEASLQNKVVVLLPPEPSIKEVQFLHKILAASGISDDQVFLQEKVYQARGLALFAGSRMVLSFGAVSDFKADYQLRSKAITVIMADRLSVVDADIEAKKKLWAAMKSFFK